MTYEEFDKLYEKMVLEEIKVGQTKGKEYTVNDRLDNFKRIGQELGVSPKLVLWVYLKKHIDSIANYIKREQKISEWARTEPLSEPIEGRIMDARVYLALLRGLIEEERADRKLTPSSSNQQGEFDFVNMVVKNDLKQTLRD